MDVWHSSPCKVKGQDHFTTEMIKSHRASSTSYGDRYPAGFRKPVHHLDRCKGCVSVDQCPTCPIVLPAMFGAFATRQARRRALDKLSTNPPTLPPLVRSNSTLT